MASFLDYARRNPDGAQRKLEAAGRRLDALRARGICTHGWLQGPPGPKDAPTDHATCLHCGQTWPTMEEAYQAGREAWNS